MMLLVASLAIAGRTAGQNAVPSGTIETEAWLRYAPLDPKVINNYSDLPTNIVVLGDSPVLESARQELSRGIDQMLGKKLAEQIAIRGNDLILGTSESLKGRIPRAHHPRAPEKDGYFLTWVRIRGAESLLITAANDRGVLYGVFALLSKIARRESIASLDELQQPYAPIRWVNQWDNLDGTHRARLRRASIFFEDGKVRDDLTRAGQYARLAGFGWNQRLHRQQRERRARSSGR